MTIPLLVGCIADDLTGATDLGVTLTREQFGVIQVNGVPGSSVEVPPVDVIVVALKSRTIPAEHAVAQSLAALAWLQHRGAERIYFKYCSTFDSTPEGNIGPVTDALMQRLGVDCVVTTPAYPRNGRTVYHGYLFVGDLLLSESGMRDHPLTPMTDSNLVRVLAGQTRYPVGNIDYSVVARGADTVARSFDKLRLAGIRHVIVDAICDEDLMTLGVACRDMSLTTGGAGMAMGIARALRERAAGSALEAESAPNRGGRAVVLAGSSSEATRAQVAIARNQMRSFRLDPLGIANDPTKLAALIGNVAAAIGDEPVLVYATAEPEEIAITYARLGRQSAAHVVEDAFRHIARALSDAGVRTFVVAGGETAGAVVDSLGIQAMRIGREIDPGVPWTTSIGSGPYWLALKSGNFGGPDFFSKALRLLHE